MTTVQAAEPKWFDHLPPPRSKPAQISGEDLHTLLGKDEHKVLVVDVRRTDIEVSQSIAGDTTCLQAATHVFHDSLSH